MQLDRVPAHQRVYLDATVCIYHFVGASAQCTRFVERCERGSIAGVTGAHVLAHETITASATFRREHGLLVNDSLTAALLRLAQIQAIATSDRDFLRVPGLDVYLPTDLSPMLPGST